VSRVATGHDLHMRRPRLKVENGIYHCISRITGGRYWLTDECKGMWCDQLRRVSQFCGVEVLTYAVLDNHFHLLVFVPTAEKLSDSQLVERYRALNPHRPKLIRQLEAKLEEGGTQAENLRTRLFARMHDVSQFLKELKQRFTMWFNARHQLFGTIWAERFKSLLVENDPSVLRIVGAYIDLNPLRAKMAIQPEKYRWCGLAAAERGDPLAQAGVMTMVGAHGWAEARRLYRKFVYETGSPPSQNERHATVDAAVKDTNEWIANPCLWTRQKFLSEGWMVGSGRFAQATKARFSTPSGA